MFSETSDIVSAAQVGMLLYQSQCYSVADEQGRYGSSESVRTRGTLPYLESRRHGLLLFTHVGCYQEPLPLVGLFIISLGSRFLSLALYVERESGKDTIHSTLLTQGVYVFKPRTNIILKVLWLPKLRAE